MVQGVLLLVVVAIVVARVRTLAFVSNIDLPALRRAVRDLIEAEDWDRAHAVLQAAAPSWAARCALALVDPELEEGERVAELEERLMDAKAASTDWMQALRASATIASALGFIGAALQIHWVFNGDHGLAALQAGRIENEGLAKALLSIAIGISTSSLALGSWTLFRKAAHERVAECRRLVASIESVIGDIE